MNAEGLGGSFRDPSGFVFERQGELYRQVNAIHAEHYDHLVGSGLYDHLVRSGLLIPHQEVDIAASEPTRAYRILRPERIEFISYPYEWCFGQLRDAARVTIKAQAAALDHGMSLRDASAYNVQFRGGRPLLIDTLSFEKLPEGTPWVAYRQFCQHFLAPLALMSHRDVRLGQLLRVHLDGIPLDLAVRLLPWRTRLRPSLLLHIFLHARSQRRYEREGTAASRRSRPFTLRAFRGLVDSLAGAIERLSWTPKRTAWLGYYSEAESYTSRSLDHKKELVAKFVQEARPATAWDLGANVGVFSRLAASQGVRVISFDADHAAVEANYREATERGERNLLPLVIDLTNPSPAIGWQNRERMALLERGPTDLVLALALVHHLALGNNVPLDRLARVLRSVGSWLVVEFVPKSDPKVRQMLATREDVFPGYTSDGFERAFRERFTIRRREPIDGSERILYLMEGR